MPAPCPLLIDPSRRVASPVSLFTHPLMSEGPNLNPFLASSRSPPPSLPLSFHLPLPTPPYPLSHATGTVFMRVLPAAIKSYSCYLPLHHFLVPFLGLSDPTISTFSCPCIARRQHPPSFPPSWYIDSEGSPFPSKSLSPPLSESLQHDASGLAVRVAEGPPVHTNLRRGRRGREEGREGRRERGREGGEKGDVMSAGNEGGAKMR